MSDKEQTYDVVMIGAGPSALAAAVYTTREGISTLLIEKGVIGGLAAVTDLVENYPGFAKGVTGLELADAFHKQAERFGAKIELAEVTKITRNDDFISVITDQNTYQTKAVLISTGSDYKKLGIPGEKELFGRGVHYCATCDGAFYKDKRLVVVGGGNSAVQEALYLTRFASHIDLLVRSTLRASDVLLKKMKDEAKITVHLGTTTDEIESQDGKVIGVAGTNNGQKMKIATDGVFVFVGLLPNTQFLDGSGIELDERGFIKTDSKLMTSVTGVFASGDVRSGATMQIASAVGEGATAALRIREYLED